MGMDIAVGVMAVIVLVVSMWCWKIDRQGKEEDTAEIEQSKEKKM